MNSASLDRLDRQIIHALIVDGRAPLRRIATVVGVSEQTVARRYRRMRMCDVVRVVGMADSQRLGLSDWLIRLQPWAPGRNPHGQAGRHGAGRG